MNYLYSNSLVFVVFKVLCSMRKKGCKYSWLGRIMLDV